MQISNIQIINELEQAGKLRSLIKGGLFPAKILSHRDIYYYVDAHIKSGINKTDAVYMAADHFGKHTRTIERILSSFLTAF